MNNSYELVNIDSLDKNSSLDSLALFIDGNNEKKMGLIEIQLDWKQDWRKLNINQCGSFRLNSRNRNESSKEQSLYDCLRMFNMPEQLDEDNEWYCPKCKEHKRAQK